MRLVAAVYHLGGGFDADDIISNRSIKGNQVQGFSVNSGHYVSIIRTVRHGWLMCNDLSITQVQEFPTHLRHAAILFLERFV